MRVDRFSTIFTVFTALILCTAMLFTAPGARAAAPSGGKLDFTVLRDGDQIGRHVLSFKKDADALTVNIETKTEVKVLFVTAYAFEHQGREVWQNGKLVELASATNDDGTKHTLAVKNGAGALAINGDGQTSKAAVEIIPASLWHEGILAGGVILNTLHGKQMKITVRDAGSESIPVAGQSVAAQHYVIEGDLQRELWFDETRVLVKVRFKGNDGSNIEYVLR